MSPNSECGLSPSGLARQMLQIPNYSDEWLLKLIDGTMTHDYVLEMIKVAGEGRNDSTVNDYDVSLKHLAESISVASWDGSQWVNYDELMLKIACDYFKSFASFYKRVAVGSVLARLFSGTIGDKISCLSVKNITMKEDEMRDLLVRVNRTIYYGFFSQTLPIYMSLYSFIESILNESDVLMDLSLAYLDEIGPTIT